MRAGLCSVTFRALAPGAIIDAAAGAGLDAVEWGADVHVRPGDTATAEWVAARCADSGLACPSYGSYLMAGASPVADVAPALDVAEALGAATVRVWCQYGVRPGAPAVDSERVEEGLAAIVGAVAGRGLSAGLEFHPRTLTETAASTRSLLDAVGHPSLFAYWQPVAGDPVERSLAEYDAVAADVSNLHVFWWRSREDRRPLEEGEPLWRPVLAGGGAHHRWSGERFAYLEFVRGDDLDRFRADAATLRRWIAEFRR